jgi:hypothetical protein
MHGRDSWTTWRQRWISLNSPVAVLTVPATGSDIDHRVLAALSRTTASLPVVSRLLAAGDRAMNLSVSPGAQMALALWFLDYADQLVRYDAERFVGGTGEARRRIETPARDRRFEGDAWLR